MGRCRRAHSGRPTYAGRVSPNCSAWRRADVPAIRTLLGWSRSAPWARLGPDFTKLWLSRTVSELGSGIGGTALPLAAVLVLKATPLQMGLLAAVGVAPVLVVGLLAGAWVDRLRRRPILIAAD